MGSSVRFPEWSNFYVGDPYHEGDLSVSALKGSRGFSGTWSPARHTEGVEVNSRRVDLFVNDLRYFRYYGSTHNVLRASVGVNCQPQHQDHYLLPEAPPGFALADIFPGQLGVATPTLYGPYGQTPSTLRRLLSRWRPMAVLDPLPLDHLFPARDLFDEAISSSLLKTSLPLLEGGWGVYSGIARHLHKRITLQDFFAHQRVSHESPDQTSRTPRDTGLISPGNADSGP